MVDNTLLEEMSMSPAHFVPRTAELNALGVQRLIRLASILQVYGGTVRYDGTDADKSLRQSRTRQIESFLAASGLKPGEFSVEQGLAGGDGMAAAEAVDIRQTTRGPGDTAIGSQGGSAGSSGGGTGGLGAGATGGG